VDEETFFRSQETGGTVVSTALAEMQRIVAERYPLEDWNIYAAQASDGDNYSATARPARACCATNCCRSASISPMSRWSTSARPGCSGRKRRERALARLQGRGRRPCEFRDAAGVLQGRYLPGLPPAVLQDAQGGPEVRMSTAASQRPASRLLYETGEWSFDTLKRTYDAIEEIAVGEMGSIPIPTRSR